MPEFPRTLAMRLTLLYAAIFAVLSFAAFFVAYVWIEARLDARIDADLREDLAEFQNLLSAEGLEGVRNDFLREIGADDAGQVLLRVTDGSGRPLFGFPPPVRTGTAWENSSYAAVIAGAEPRLKTVTAGEDGDDMRVLLGRLGPGLVIEIGESLQEKEDVLGLLLGAFTAILVVGAAVAAAVGWIMSRAALQGIEEVTQAAGDVAAGNFDRRVAVSNRGEEIGRLAGTFNVMVDRIRALILEMKVMTDNIAHDLRSPLTRLRASVEEAVLRARSVDEFRAASEETLEECDRLLQMINTTLDVTEAEGSAVALTKQDVDLGIVVVEAVELFEPVADDKSIRISLKLASGCHVHGNLQYLQRMVANLIDNAIKYTREGGAVTVEMTRTNGFVSISVSDTGIGIDPEDQRRIFDRFFRCDESRSEQGFGLGLSFVRAVASAHSGRVELESAVNQGSRFTVSLPALGAGA